MRRPFNNPKAGFSLMEMVLLLVVIAIAAPPMMAMLKQSLEDNAHLAATRTAIGLGQGLMEETLSADFDDIDYYDGLNAKPPVDSQGRTLSQFDGYRVRADVEAVSVNDPGGPAVSGDTDLKRVTVRVLWNNDAQSIRFVGLRSNHPEREEEPGYQDGLRYLSRQGNWQDRVQFQFRNETGETVYLTHMKASWDSPEVYYSEITLRVLGGNNYGTIWHCEEHNNVRLGSGEVAMFNQGKVVALPPQRNVRVEIRGFRASRQYPGGGSANIRNTGFTIEFWAAPLKYEPMFVPG